jgi:trehalose synthase
MGQPDWSAALQAIDLPPLDAARFEPLLEPAQAATFARDMRLAAAELEGHTYWHVNSTASDGGVAEMLQSVLSYVQGGGVQTRWLVIDGDDEFFAITKRIHHFLHGSEGDGGVLGAHEWAAYSATLQRQVDELSAAVSPGDVVVLHDPQTVGFAPMLRKMGAGVIWSCHVGTDAPNDYSAKAWEFLAPSAMEAHRVVFSRSTYAWDVFDRSTVEIIPPCIDAFSPKNQFLEPETVRAILARSGLLPDAVDAPTLFHRQDGTQAHADGRAEMIEESPIEPDAPVLVQISRGAPSRITRG